MPYFTFPKKAFPALLFLILSAAGIFAAEPFPIWPEGKIPDLQEHQTIPTLEICRPNEKKSDACVLILPGGAYRKCCDQHEGSQIANFFNEKGVTAAILRYRVSRPENAPKHRSAWQDAQRAVRFLRANALELGFHPEKIGCLGFSAGGHLTLMTAAASQTPAYLAIDELDKIPCHVNFAVPVYPAYLLAECADRPYSGTGENLKLVPELQFDSQTPPMCLIHGDADSCPAYASIAVYHKLRTMNIPAEIHIYAKVGHGFGAARGGDHFKAWLDRVHDWMKLMRF